MKTLRLILPVISAVLLIIFSESSTVFAQKIKSIEPNTLIKLDGFSITSPSGDDWEYTLHKSRKEVYLYYESSNILTGSATSTIVSVYKDSLITPAEKEVKEYADAYLDKNVSDFKHSGVAGVRIKSTRKSDTTITGRKFYAIAYNASYRIENLQLYLDDVFFLYFPDDFEESRIFFGFNISCSYNQPLGIFNINSSDLKPVFGILKSFKMQESVKPETGK